jgi:hypothetical protein
MMSYSRAPGLRLQENSRRKLRKLRKFSELFITNQLLPSLKISVLKLRITITPLSDFDLRDARNLRPAQAVWSCLIITKM